MDEKGWEVSNAIIEGWTRDNPDDLEWMGYDLPGLPDEKEAETEECEHKWVITGYSPVTNLAYKNCKWCDIREEDVTNESN